MKTSSGKNKGRRLQQDVANRIGELLQVSVGQNGDVESRGMGQGGVDIRLSPKALEQFQFSIECKNQETWNIHKWIEQAKENQIGGTDWLLVAKRNRTKPVVVMDMEVFFELCRKSGENS